MGPACREKKAQQLQKGINVDGLHRIIIVIGLAGWSATAASASPDDATRFFKNHPHAIDLEQRGDRILFANRLIGLEIQKHEGGFQLKRLYGIEQDQDYLVRADGEAGHDLFELKMTLDPIHVGRDDSHLTKTGGMGIIEEMAWGPNPKEERLDFAVAARGAQRTSWRKEARGSDIVLHLEMNGFDAKEDKGV